MKPYDCVSFSTRPSSRPSESVTANEAASPFLSFLSASFCSWRWESLMRSGLRLPSNLFSMTSNTTVSPGLSLGHESSRSAPSNSMLFSLGVSPELEFPSFASATGAAGAPPSAGNSSSLTTLVPPGASPGLCGYMNEILPPYESILVRPRRPRRTVPTRLASTTTGLRSSSDSLCTLSALALPSLSLGAAPGTASRTTNLTSSFTRRSSMPFRSITSEAWKNRSGPFLLSRRTKPNESLTVLTTPNSKPSRVPLSAWERDLGAGAGAGRGTLAPPPIEPRS
mmetsp:Transcript_11490/g.31973  ORF Transcript_11490/g.31973 Transcript_11490/m.31973 type:complete len:282 (-) Transcript_11490:227-1072(-)